MMENIHAGPQVTSRFSSHINSSLEINVYVNYYNVPLTKFIYGRFT